MSTSEIYFEIITKCSESRDLLLVESGEWRISMGFLSVKDNRNDGSRKGLTSPLFSSLKGLVPHRLDYTSLFCPGFLASVSHLSLSGIMLIY